VNATAPTGATVSYPAAVGTDNCSTPVITYSKPSGSLFPIGDTAVTVTAVDLAGNKATSTFNVHVKGAAEQLRDLIAYVEALPIHHGTKRSLVAKLAAAKSALEAGKSQVASDALKDFINEASAQKSNKLSVAQADRLISDASRTRAVIETP
jgi:hypothetical protein